MIFEYNFLIAETFSYTSVTCKRSPVADSRLNFDRNGKNTKSTIKLAKHGEKHTLIGGEGYT